MNDAIARITAAARRRVDAGDPNVLEMWNRTGGSKRYDRGAAGGPTTTTGPPPPSSDAQPLRYTHAAVLHPWGRAWCAVERAGVCAARSGAAISTAPALAGAWSRRT
jgi:hypothetical protein